MGVREALLGLLCVQPAHGYDLKARYDNVSKDVESKEKGG